jgi:hypothetical protein
MRGVAHRYPEDMDALMGEAFAFVLSHESDDPAGGRADGGDADAAGHRAGGHPERAADGGGR